MQRDFAVLQNRRGRIRVQVSQAMQRYGYVLGQGLAGGPAIVVNQQTSRGAILQDLLPLGQGKSKVQRHPNGPDLTESQPGGDLERMTLGETRHPVTRSDPPGQQMGHAALNQRLQIGVGDALPLKNQRHVLRMAVADLSKDTAQRFSLGLRQNGRIDLHLRSSIAQENKPAWGARGMDSLLFIEDDHRLAGMVSDYLSQSGFQVTHAATAKEGLSHLSQQKPHDLVILDVMLPDSDGLDVCRRIRSLEGARGQTPIVMLTAKGDPLDRVVGLEIGADIGQAEVDAIALGGEKNAVDVADAAEMQQRGGRAACDAENAACGGSGSWAGVRCG